MQESTDSLPNLEGTNLQDIYAVESGFLAEPLNDNDNPSPKYLNSDKHYQSATTDVYKQAYVAPNTSVVPESLVNPEKRVADDIAMVTASLHAYRLFTLRQGSIK